MIENSGDSLVYSTYLGGVSDEIGWGVEVDGANNIYVAGGAGSANFPVVGSLQPLRGFSDAFVTKMSAPPPPTPTPTPTPPLEPATISFASDTGRVLERDGSFGALVVRTGNLNRTDRIAIGGFNGTATERQDFNGFVQFLTFEPGVDHLVFTADILDDTQPEGNETFTLKVVDNRTGAITGSNPSMTVTIEDDDTFPANSVDFAHNTSSPLNVFESFEAFGHTLGTRVDLTVRRSGNLSRPASVDYTTVDSAASSRTDYTYAAGTLRFAPGETTKTFSILITEDHYVESDEIFAVILSNPVGTIIGSGTARIAIFSDDQSETTNPSDETPTFVDQHYNDFLNRQADASGFNFWSQEIDGCGADAGCRSVKRINTSAAFFLSIEFQETGYLVYRMYKAAFGNIPNTPIPVRFQPFMADTQEIRRGVRVGIGDWTNQLEANKAAFQLAFVQRGSFKTALPEALTPAQYVDTLDANTGHLLTPQQREALINALVNGGNTAQARAQVLRQVAENPAFSAAETNRAFVLMQYFGYLRRDPDAPGFSDQGDPNFSGYNFWLGKLDQFNGDYIAAEMVKAFIESIEYRRRFGR